MKTESSLEDGQDAKQEEAGQAAQVGASAVIQECPPFSAQVLRSPGF